MRLMHKIEQCGYRVGVGIGHLLAWPIDWAMRVDLGEIPLVIEEEEVMEYAIQCFGGPKDGHEEVVKRDGQPDFLYVWESVDDHRMTRVSDAAREALRARIGTLAYRFDRQIVKEGKPRDVQYIYVYDEKRNKRHVEKVAKAPKE